MQRHFTSGSRQAPDPYDQFLEQHNYYRKHTARDPSCLFRVISEQLYDTQKHHLSVRKRCVLYMRKHRQSFEPLIVDRDFDEYLDDLCKPKTHCTLVELQAVGFMFNRTVLLFEPFTLGYVYSSSSSQNNKVFRVFYTPEYHFDSVFTTDYIKDAAICQAIVYELLYKDLFKLPDVSFAVEQMLYVSPQDCSLFSSDVMREEYSSYIRLNNGHAFKLDLPSNTNCVLENFRLCHFHNPNFSNLDVENDSLEQSGKCGSVLPLKYISCVRQLLHEGITPFPYKVAKALDPNMYRNIEFDSWSEIRKELRLQNWYSGDCNFKIGAKCHVRLKKSETDLYTCHIQEISTDKSYCVVFIEQLAEKRVVPYENLSPLPPDQFHPWALPYRLQQRLQKYNCPRYHRSRSNYHWRTASTAATCYLKNNQYYQLKQFTQLDYFGNHSIDYYTMPFMVDHTGGGNGVATSGSGTPTPIVTGGTNTAVTEEHHSTEHHPTQHNPQPPPTHGRDGAVLVDNGQENGGVQYYTDVSPYVRYPDDNSNGNGTNNNGYHPYEGGPPPSPYNAQPQPMYVMFNPVSGAHQPPSYYMSPSGVPTAPPAYTGNGNGVGVPYPPPPVQNTNPYFQNPPLASAPQPQIYQHTPRHRTSTFTTSPISSMVNFDVKRSSRTNGTDLPSDTATLRYFFNLGVDYHNSNKKNPLSDGTDKKGSLMDLKNIKTEDTPQELLWYDQENCIAEHGKLSLMMLTGIAVDLSNKPQVPMFKDEKRNPLGILQIEPGFNLELRGSQWHEPPPQPQPLLPDPPKTVPVKSGSYQNTSNISCPSGFSGGRGTNRRNNNSNRYVKDRPNFQRGSNTGNTNGGGSVTHANNGSAGAAHNNNHYNNNNNYQNKNSRANTNIPPPGRTNTPNSNRFHNQGYPHNSGSTTSLGTGFVERAPPSPAPSPILQAPQMPQPPSIIIDSYEQITEQCGEAMQYAPQQLQQPSPMYYNYEGGYDGENSAVPLIPTQIPANAGNAMFVQTPYGVFQAPPGTMGVNPYGGMPAGAPPTQLMQVPGAPMATASTGSRDYYASMELTETSEGYYQMPAPMTYPMIAPNGQYYYASTPAMMQQMPVNGGSVVYPQAQMAQPAIMGMQPVGQNPLWVPHPQQQQQSHSPQQIQQQAPQAVAARNGSSPTSTNGTTTDNNNNNNPAITNNNNRYDKPSSGNNNNITNDSQGKRAGSDKKPNQK